MRITKRCSRISIITATAVAFIALLVPQRRLSVCLAAFAATQSSQPKPANGLDAAAIRIQFPNEIEWTENKTTGSLTASLYGDPSKSGLYITLNKWPANKMGLPHTHPNDRFITVISGIWWVGTGAQFDRDRTVPVSPGSSVTHFARQVHFDGAKDGDTALQVVGMGPGTSRDGTRNVNPGLKYKVMSHGTKYPRRPPH